MNDVFDTWKLGAMLLDIVIGFGLPLSLAMLFRKKYKVRISVLIIGIGTYILVNGILSSIFDVIVYYLPISDFLNSNNSASAIFYGLFHGLIHFGGYYAAMRFLLKGYDRKENALMFGVGLSFIDAFYYNAVGGFMNFLVATQVNEWGREGYLGRFQDEARTYSEDVVDTLANMGISEIVGSVIFMILEMGFMIAASVLLFQAVKRAGKTYLLYTVAALLVIFNLVICFRSVEILGEVAYLVITGVLTTITGFGAYIFYGADKEEIKGKGDLAK